MSAFSALKLDSLSTKKIAASIQQLMQKHKLSEAELARELDIPVMTVRRLVSGETTDPRISTLQLFADYFDVTLDDLAQNSNAPKNVVNAQPNFVPVFSWHEAEVIQDLETFDRSTWEHWQAVTIPEINYIHTHCFAIQTKSTMQPKFPLGTLLIIDQKEQSQDGDLILIRTNDNKLTLKEFIWDSPNKILHPIVKGSETTLYQPNLHKIIGVVILTLLFPRKR